VRATRLEPSGNRRRYAGDWCRFPFVNESNGGGNAFELGEALRQLRPNTVYLRQTSWKLTQLRLT
jgi:hypothetical protein